MTYPYYTNTSQMPVGQRENSACSVPFFVFPAVAGGIIGILSVIGENFGSFTIISQLIAQFSQLSSGLFMWAVFCTGIAVLAKSQLRAAVSVFSFLGAMMTSYTLLVELCNLDCRDYILVFRLLALLPASLAGMAAWHLRRSDLLRKLAFLPAGFCLMFDLRVMYFTEPLMLISEFALGVLFLVILRYAAQQDTHPPVPYYAMMQQ